jgi:Tfp pilus assembly protein PilV
VGHNTDRIKREVCRHECPQQKIQQLSNNLMMHLKLLEKQEQANSKNSGWKKNFLISAGIK